MSRSSRVFDFGIEVAGEVGVLGESVYIEVPEYILGLFEYRVEMVECEMLDHK